MPALTIQSPPVNLLQSGRARVSKMRRPSASRARVVAASERVAASEPDAREQSDAWTLTLKQARPSPSASRGAEAFDDLLFARARQISLRGGLRVGLRAGRDGLD